MHFVLSHEDAWSLNEHLEEISDGVHELTQAFELLQHAFSALPRSLRRQRDGALEKLKAKHVISWKGVLALLPALSVFANVQSHLFLDRLSQVGEPSPEAVIGADPIGAQGSKLGGSTSRTLERAAMDAADKCGTNLGLQIPLLRSWRRYAPWLEETVQSLANRPRGSRCFVVTWLSMHPSHPHPPQTVAPFTARIIRAQERIIVAIEHIQALLLRQLDDCRRYRGFEMRVKDQVEYVEGWKDTRSAIKQAKARVGESHKRLANL